MKICPKCGQELEGDKCPKCTGPEIIVNNDAYLQRKKAYEEKQAREKESASSRSDAENIEEVFVRLKNNSRTMAKKVRKMTVKQENTEQKEQKEEVRSVRRKKKNKKVITGLVLVAVMLVITASAYGIYKLASRKNYTLYMSYNGKIYDAASIDSSFVCEQSDAVFASDKKTFYIAEWPDMVDKNKLSETHVSQNGKYFGAVTYDDATMEYSLYVWNEQECMEVSKDRNQKNLKTITNEGTVIYTDTEVVNQQGYVGNTALYVCDSRSESHCDNGSKLAGNSTKIEDTLISAYVYSDSDLIIYTNSGNNLYTYNYNKKEKNIIAESVEGIFTMSDETAYHYVSQASDENSMSYADSFIYVADNSYYYYNLANNTEMKIGRISGTNISFIYDKKNSCIYIIGSGTISYAKIKDGAVQAFNEIDSLSAKQNMVYISDERQLVYINDNGQLMSVSKGNAKLIRENVKDGSLTRIGNTDTGIMYIADDMRVYRQGLSDEEITLYTAADELGTADTYMYKNRLYYYRNGKELYSINKKGKDENKIGLVDSLWLGTEWK